MGSRSNAGFTLVEIMIVVAIVGLLAAIAIPNFSKARTTARKNACINNLRLIDGAKEQYALENGKDSTTTPAAADITPYLKDNLMPQCPSSTTNTYSINPISTNPTCSVNGHQLS